MASSLTPVSALSEQPSRVIFVYVPMGASKQMWHPTECNGGIALRPGSAPLEPVKRHCVFLNNLNMPDGGLGVAQVSLGGGFTDARASTLDIVLGDAFNGNVLTRNLHLGAYSGHDVVSIRSFNRVPFAQSAAAVYDSLFGDDREANTPLDQKFRAELASSEIVHFDKEVDLQIELSALALSRNATNVITLMWGDYLGNFSLPEYFTAYPRMTYHEATHHSHELYTLYRAYLSAKFAYLIQLLEVMKDENNQSLLDTTLVVHLADQGDADIHGSENAPFFIAGGKNRFRNGAVLDVKGANQYDLMDTIAAAYGVDTQYGTSKIDGLTLS
ncbi:MAG: DUF1552 domain-containing protein [Cellvibrionaceae bacterium]|nr:DUF1552 domain-containing protein [Cellvibrionaceae bacterium]